MWVLFALHLFGSSAVLLESRSKQNVPNGLCYLASQDFVNKAQLVAYTISLSHLLEVFYLQSWNFVQVLSVKVLTEICLDTYNYY